ncbi:MAG: helix-turn-helix domain-containing protein [Candidatus Aenigmarchaeota archaeon]|nr:helix-turn-helix domain-containing protein [Candidatus Aenigmarchaeota archaeon]
MEILTIRETANLLKVSPRTIRRYMELGLPYVQVVKGGRITFEKNQVLKWWLKFSHPYSKFLRRSK